MEGSPDYPWPLGPVNPDDNNRPGDVMEGSRDCLWPLGLPKPFVPGARTERRDATEHRRRILEVARRLFAERGVDAVSMHQIAMAAGIGQGTLYRRYAHKGELCMDLLHERHEQFVEEIATHYAATVTSSALERLDGVLAHFVAFLEEQGALLGPVAGTNKRDWQCNEADNSRHFSFQDAPFYLWMHELFAGLFAEAVRQGELPPLDIDFTTDAILTTLHPMFYRLQRQERGFSPERILQGLRRIYIDGVKTAHISMGLAEANEKATV
jgi:AcrR family transcriptional regulator